MAGDRPALVPWVSVERLKGIGPRLREALVEHGVKRVVDLLLHLPSRYEDRTQRVTLDQPLEADQNVLVWGTATVTSVRWGRRRGMKIVDGTVNDGRGTLPVVWFNQPWIEGRLEGDRTLSFHGRVRSRRGGGLQLVNPEVNDIDDGGEERIVPVYRRLGPLGGRRLRRLIDQSLGALEQCPDPLPEDVRNRLQLPDLAAALGRLHDPDPAPDEKRRAEQVIALCEHRTEDHRRLAFDELLIFACRLAESRSMRVASTAPACRIETSVDHIASEMFPFALTGGQRRVVEEIAGDLAGNRPMARLVQGDVGSGKTAVAAVAIWIALDSGHQVALMAPTELLAEQHHRTLQRVFRDGPFPVELLTASAPAVDRSRVLDGLADGAVRFVIGTHALIQERVRFQDLALVVIDEQHRFGVSQRQALVKKGVTPHLLVMTATPIPRSLALTVYGDLDLSIIDELPPGRRPVTTAVRDRSARPRLLRFLRQEVAAGGRVFFVFPMIDANEHLDGPALEESAQEIAASLPDAVTAVIHGRMSKQDRESIADRFCRGEVQVLLATTVVEVGIDVPEATVMVVEGADRFGLSQLHQLRGRVGRGTRKSWCVLIPGEDSGEAASRRLEVLCRSSDGFDIAEADLEIRGPGELTGLRQWGPAGFRFANLIRHRDLLVPARDIARELGEDGRLSKVREALLRYHPCADMSRETS